MSEENKQIARRVAEEGFAKGNVAVLDELLAEDIVNNDPSVPPEIPPGREGIKVLAQGYAVAFPDMDFKVEDQIAEGDKVVTRWSAKGTHQGELLGIPATGKQTIATGITIDRIEGGKIIETWTHWDNLGLLQQLGVVPTVGAPTQK
jgi:steroid delta-isomerase-like uncharacterized protein